MRANFKLVLVVSVPVHGETLEEGIAKARTLQVHRILKFKPDVEHLDGSIELLSVDSEEWIE